MACATAPPVTTPPTPASVPHANPTQPESAPTPVAPPPPTTRRVGAWTFAYAPGTYSYTIRTDATIAPVSDTALKQSIPELNQLATIVISGDGDIQVTDPVAATSGSCDANAALLTRAQQLIPRIPNQLTIGTRWRDSTTTSGCRSTIPAESTVISNYVVLGDTTTANIPVLQIQRMDSISASGEGTNGQHRILVTAVGTGTMHFLLDYTTGRLAGLNGTQSTVVNVTTSGRLMRFIQNVTESVSLTGLR